MAEIENIHCPICTQPIPSSWQNGLPPALATSVQRGVYILKSGDLVGCHQSLSDTHTDNRIQCNSACPKYKFQADSRNDKNYYLLCFVGIISCWLGTCEVNQMRANTKASYFSKPRSLAYVQNPPANPSPSSPCDSAFFSPPPDLRQMSQKSGCH